MMDKLMENVAAFRKACGEPVSTNPHLLTQDREDRNAKLILSKIDHDLTTEMHEGNLVGIAKGIAEAIYTLVGTALEYGIPLDNVWEEIHFTNMAKVDPATDMVAKTPSGTIIKPAGWKQPNIKKALMTRTEADI